MNFFEPLVGIIVLIIVVMVGLKLIAVLIAPFSKFISAIQDDKETKKRLDYEERLRSLRALFPEHVEIFDSEKFQAVIWGQRQTTSSFGTVTISYVKTWS
jgi:hypothetical protein